MAQLLVTGLIALGLLSITLAVLLTRQTKKAWPVQDAQPVPSISQAEQHVTTLSTEEQQRKALTSSVPPTSQPVTLPTIVDNTVSSVTQHVLPMQTKEPLPEWWHEQFQSLTGQLQHLREHSKDVERQIEILCEIATLANELETLQKKHIRTGSKKPLLFPLKVNRQPTDASYLTEKRPAVRKYRMKAI